MYGNGVHDVVGDARCAAVGCELLCFGCCIKLHPLTFGLCTILQYHYHTERLGQNNHHPVLLVQSRTCTALLQVVGTMIIIKQCALSGPTCVCITHLLHLCMCTHTCHPQVCCFILSLVHRFVGYNKTINSY